MIIPQSLVNVMQQTLDAGAAPVESVPAIQQYIEGTQAAIDQNAAANARHTQDAMKAITIAAVAAPFVAPLLAGGGGALAAAQAAGAAAVGGAEAVIAGAAGLGSAALNLARSAGSSVVSGAESFIAGGSTLLDTIKQTFLPEEDMSLSSMFRTAAKQGLQSFVSGLTGDAQPTGPVIWDSGPVYGSASRTGMPMAIPAAFPAFPAMLGSAGTLAARALPAIRSGAAAVGRFVLGGKVISRAKVAELARKIGIEGTAVALGVGAVEVAQAVMDESSKRGRGRGVTAAQIRTTRRTMRTIERMHRQIVSACRSAHVPARRTVVVSGKRCR